jgi:alginate O-acetyltransferase complex protein AlgI
MLFGTPVFLFAFLPAVLLLHLLLPRGARNALLLVASLLFYAWGEPRFALVMLTSIAGNYACGLWVEAARRRLPAGAPAPRAPLVAALVFNLGLLGYFKYAGLVWQALGAVAPLPEFEPPPLPIGISFFTFQALSYVIDVHRRGVAVQRNPIDFALFVALFPQLIAGPIVRYVDVAREIRARSVDRARFAAGARRFVFGLGKKLVIADVLGRTADAIFALGPEQLSTGSAWLGLVCYTLQIYFDFSAYSDMAIGLGHMLGFRFLENFDYPYVSASISEFWRRWHISLSTWFRDYLYIPLGGNRGGPWRTGRNLLIVFALCGLWHGASWTFVAWGLYHGLFLVLERVGLIPGLDRWPRPLRHVYVLAVVMHGWVLFRADGFAHAADYLAALWGGGAPASASPPALYADALVRLVLVAGAVGSLPLFPALARWREQLAARGAAGLGALAELGRTAAYLVVLAAALLELAGGTFSPFIYFRF